MGSKRRPVTAGGSDELPVVAADVAGIDVGSRQHYVAVPPERDEQPVRSFGCLTPDLVELAEWLKQCGIHEVVMESTGVYWVPLYRLLEERGFQVVLVDARQMRHVPGRKTDVLDCQWLRQLHSHGLLRACFVPPGPVAELREYWRQRGTLVTACAQAIHRMHKALEQMNLQLHKVLSDVSGVTGMQILRAIIAGEQDPARLAALPHPEIKASDEELRRALTGCYRREQLLCLRQALEAYDFHQQQLAVVDEALQACLAQFEGPADREPPRPPRPPKRRKNQPGFDLRAELTRVLGVDATRIDGLDALTVQSVIAETGPDFSRWATEKQFSAWTQLAPNPEVTGGRVRRQRRRPPNRAGQALKVAAQSLARSDSAMGAYYRRMKAAHGPGIAIKATAHRLARMLYRCVRYGEAYVDQGQAAYEAMYRERRRAALLRQATHLGYDLVPRAELEGVY